MRQLAAMDFEQSMALLQGEGSVDLDKLWNVAFVLVEQLASPLSFLGSATPAGTEDMGYGPVMTIDSATTKSLAAAVAGVGDDSVNAAYDELDFDEIYPGIFDDDDARVEAIGAFRALANLMGRAASTERALIFAIT